MMDNQLCQLLPPDLQPLITSHQGSGHPSWLEKAWRDCRDEHCEGFLVDPVSGVFDGGEGSVGSNVFPIVELKHTGLASPVDSTPTVLPGVQDDMAATRICFGDVGVKTTIARAWGVLTLRQKLKFTWGLLCDRCAWWWTPHPWMVAT